MHKHNSSLIPSAAFIILLLKEEKVGRSLWVETESLPQVEEFGYLGVLLMSNGRTDILFILVNEIVRSGPQ